MRLVVLLGVMALSFPSAHAKSPSAPAGGRVQLQKTILKEQHQLFGFTYRGAKKFLARARSLPRLAWIEKNVQVRNMPPATGVTGIMREIKKPDGKTAPYNTYRQNRNSNAAGGVAMLLIGGGSTAGAALGGPAALFAGSFATGPGLLLLQQAREDHRGLKASVMQSANYAATYVMTHAGDPRYRPLLDLIPKRSQPKLDARTLRALDQLSGPLSPDTKL
jgi:hypothetical protein